MIIFMIHKLFTAASRWGEFLTPVYHSVTDDLWYLALPERLFIDKWQVYPSRRPGTSGG